MKRIYLLILLWPLCWMVSCSTTYLETGFSKFNEATDVIGKNVVYSFERLQEEEMALRVAEAVGRESIKPSDLEPRVLTFAHLETRKELIRYLVNYSELLVSVFEADEKKDIMENAGAVGENLQTISQNHEDFLTGHEIGIMAAIAGAIPEALTAGTRRKTVLKFMNRNQPLLEKVAEALKAEMEATRIMVNNFFDRQFRMTIAEKWPKKESGREKLAKNGVKILINRNQVNLIILDVIRAIGLIPKVHEELKKSLKTHDTPIRILRDLVDYAFRIKALYREFAGEER
jgi:hypothetical protein